MKKVVSPMATRWALDEETNMQGSRGKTLAPQCVTCKHFVEGDSFHCRAYMGETKPMPVRLCQSDCERFASRVPTQLENLDEPRSAAFYAGILGVMVGDMIGVPVEFRSREELDQNPVNSLRAYGTHHMPFGTWSDDSSLTLALVDAMNQAEIMTYQPITEKSELTEEAEKKKLYQAFVANCIAYVDEGAFTPTGFVFDNGMTVDRAIRWMKNGVEPIECGPSTASDNGNGSLMRIMPLTYLADSMSDEEFISLVEEVSAMTHGHARSKLACLIYCKMAQALLNGAGKGEALDRAILFANQHLKEKYQAEFSFYERIFNRSILTASRDEIRSGGYVVETLEAAIWCFFHGNTFEETVFMAANLGSDTDTTAAVVGGLAGIFYGLEAIPKRYIDTLQNKERVLEILGAFVNQYCAE